MFYKTRIFVTLAVPGFNDPTLFRWDELSKKGGCFYVDIDGILPMKKGETISFNGFYSEIEAIHWNTQHSAMMVYTGITVVEESIVDACIEYLTYSRNFIKIGN